MPLQLSLPKVWSNKVITTSPSNQVRKAKLFQWEYWPFWVVYWPFIPYWAWISLRARSFFFFTAANPTIEFGGMLGESKHKIYDLIPDKFLPKTILLDPQIELAEFKKVLENHNLFYPFILKPDIGNRGWMVEKINEEAELIKYLTQTKVPFLLQEYVDHPIELGIFYHRQPEEEEGKVTSVVMKELLHVVGDGHRSIRELMKSSSRAMMHLEILEEKSAALLDSIPPLGKVEVLVSIGNHCRGTKFLDANHLITPALQKVFDDLAKTIDGFYFGRFDLRCRSLDDLYKGQHIKIMELNGAGAEPAHIYHPGRSILKGYRDIAYHLNKLCDISIANRRKGIKYYSTKEGIQALLTLRKYNKSFRNG